ncbi:MAG: hypothetical protein ABSA12_09955 [Verrucomicrobiia bacterium]|jgi:hypothetical protein
MRGIIHLIAACSLASAAFAADTNTLSTATALEIAKTIKLPEFKLDAVSFPEATRQLHDASKQYDPEHKGFQFIMDFRDKSKANVAARTKITLNLENVTLAKAAECVCRQVDGFELYSPASDVIVFQPKKTKP